MDSLELAFRLYEGVSKIFRTAAAIYTAVVVMRSTGRWVDIGSFHTHSLVGFMIFKASVRNILDTFSYIFTKCKCYE
jgi:hypothetical protein